MFFRPGPIGGGGGLMAPIAISDVSGLTAALASAGDAPATLYSLSTAAAVLPASVDGVVFEITVAALSNAASNTLFITFNADTTQTGYSLYQDNNSGSAVVFVSANNAGSINHSVAGLASGAYLTDKLIVVRMFDGTNTIIRTFGILYHNGVGLGLVGVERTFSGNVALTNISLRSNQTNGLKAGTFMAVKKIA